MRYRARGPLALERLHAPGGSGALTSPDARLVYRLPEPDLKGRTELWLSPHTRPRPAVVAIGRQRPEFSEPSEQPAAEPAESAADPAPSPHRPLSSSRLSRLRWAQLLARIYEVLPLLCPACGGEMRIIAFLTDSSTVQAILLHLNLLHRPPPVAPARGPPQAELSFDPTSDFDPTDPVPIPDLDFDPSLSDTCEA